MKLKLGIFIPLANEKADFFKAHLGFQSFYRLEHPFKYIVAGRDFASCKEFLAGAIFYFVAAFLTLIKVSWNCVCRCQLFLNLKMFLAASHFAWLAFASKLSAKFYAIFLCWVLYPESFQLLLGSCWV